MGIYPGSLGYNNMERNHEKNETQISYFTVPLKINLLWRYGYGLYRTNQHCTGNKDYRNSNRQRFCEYWLYWAISRYIYRTGKL